MSITQLKTYKVESISTVTLICQIISTLETYQLKIYADN